MGAKFIFIVETNANSLEEEALGHCEQVLKDALEEWGYFAVVSMVRGGMSDMLTRVERHLGIEGEDKLDDFKAQFPEKIFE